MLMNEKKKASRAQQIAAAVIGNALEWYDFMIFGYLTVIVSQLFFPNTNEYSSLLMTTATFGVGFFMRPIGGVVIGTIADRFGRKLALQIIISLITVSMAMMAFAPTYAVAGVGGALIIVLARLVQGFATGGEFSSSTAFLIECAPPGRRGLYGSWQMFGQGLATIFGTAVGAMITLNLSSHALYEWGWRLPFFLGMLIGPVGLWIRRNLEESGAFLEQQKKREHTPLLDVIRLYPRGVLTSIGLIACGTISTYILSVYMATYANKQLSLSLSQAYVAQLIAATIHTSLVPFFGALSDRVSPKKILIASLCIYLPVLYPLFCWINQNPSFWNFTVFLTILFLLRAPAAGAISLVMAQQFPTKVRATGMALTYNLAVMTFGGTAQFFVTWLIQATHSSISPVYYVIFGAVVGLLSAFFLTEPKFEMGSSKPLIVDVKEPAPTGK
jgi:MFS family permease